jgi:hypothetical protein
MQWVIRKRKKRSENGDQRKNHSSNPHERQQRDLERAPPTFHDRHFAAAATVRRPNDYRRRDTDQEQCLSKPRIHHTVTPSNMSICAGCI